MSYSDDASDYGSGSLIDPSAGYGDFSNAGGSIPNIAPDVASQGVANSSSPLTLPPDATGGNGSFLTSLIPTLTNGVSATINTALLSSLGQNSNLYTVDAYGNLVPKAAAAANNYAYNASIVPSTSPLTSKTALYVVGGLIVLLVILAATKK